MRSYLERSYCLTLLAEALLQQGSAREALQLCDEALEYGKRTEGRSYEPEVHRIRGEALLAIGRTSGMEAARAEIHLALQLADQRVCRLLGLRAAVSYYRLQNETGSGSEGSEALAKAVASFSCRSRWPLLDEARQFL
jgi:predicted ATPase